MGQVLQDFLKLGLMEGVDSDDSFNRLQEGATELAGQLTSSPGQIIPTVLVALDSEASASEPIFKQAEDCVLGKWKTFRSRYQDPPRALLRAVIWEALAQATAKDEQCPAITWLTSASVFPYARLGKESEAVHRLLQDLARKTEAAATERHAASSAGANIASRIPQPKSSGVTNPRLPSNSVKQWVEIALGAASGETYENSNPIPFQHNTLQNWAKEFAPRLSDAITVGVNTGLEALAKQVEASQTKLVTSVFASTKSLASAVEGVLGGRAGHSDLRLSVLWWAEALYSPSLRDSYRVLPATAAVVAMAHDLFEQVGSMTPASVAFMLGETAARLPSVSWTQKHALSSLLGELHKERGRLEDIVEEPQKHEGRRPLLETVEAVIHSAPLAAGELTTRTGLPEDLQITLPEFAMWCFRNLQARDLSEQKEEEEESE